MRSSFALTTLFTALASAGTLTIHNQCSYGVTNSLGGTINAGQTATHNIAAGVVDQVAKLVQVGGDSAHPVQIEWSSSTALFYDLSLIDGHGIGSTITPSAGIGGNGGACQVLNCPGAGAQCVDAYQHPADKETHTCNVGINLNVVLCPGGKGKRMIERAFQA